VNGSSVPPAARAAVAATAPRPCGADGMPSAAENGTAARAAPRNCTAVTATGSRPRSSRTCATVNVADSSSETSTRPSPAAEAPARWPPVTRPTPASDTANPAQATGRATVRCQTAAMTATSTGTAPISSAAWVTLVRMMPAFCTRTDPPYPRPPDASTRGVNAARSASREATASMIAAARPKRTSASQPGGSHARASLDSGTVVPHSSPAAVRAATARRRSMFRMSPCHQQLVQNLSVVPIDEIMHRKMAVELDEVDVRLLTALQEDADRTNVELARMVGLSPAATLHRVRRLKESGVIRIISAQLDPAAAGFPLLLYVAATLGRHDPRSTRVFDEQIRALPQIIAADNVAGEMDYLMTVVARDVAELQAVLVSLSTRGGQRLVTYLRLAEVKPPSRLPLAVTMADPDQPPRRRRRPDPG
jgi:Lrp/AsnC family transcriptional regulator, leucine-responsive regulatory protein